MRFNHWMSVAALALLASPLAAEEYVVKEYLLPAPINWTTGNGPEAPGAEVALAIDAGTPLAGESTLRLTGDFRHGGNYVSFFKDFNTHLNLSEIRFQAKTAAPYLLLRLTDSDWQVHQYQLPLSGNGDEFQPVIFRPTDSGTHWNGRNDGRIRPPFSRFALLLPNTGPDRVMTMNLGELEFVTDNRAAAEQIYWDLVDPAKLFRQPGDGTPVEIRLRNVPEELTPERLHYQYLDFAGNPAAAGTAEFDMAKRLIRIPAPEGKGYFELNLPDIDARCGVVIDDPPAAEPDEYYAIDSSFSWGVPPQTFELIDLYCRILSANGIVWNRDRISWTTVEPEPGQFEFANRFGIYREAATKNRIKTLECFHDAPAWTGATHGEFNFNLYPRHLIDLLDSWTGMVDRYPETMQAIEVWNEPECQFGNFYPGEQQSALTKVFSYAFRDRGTRIIGGIFTGFYFHPEYPFYRLYIDNGLLDDCDVLSFHHYNDPRTALAQVKYLRDQEIAAGTDRLGIPYWITESGRPFKVGQDRASVAEDIASAAGIAGMAMEFKALGIERYFAFEYKFYPEGPNNFGMMDANHSPMRNFAAYLHQARLLAHFEYIGDLAGADSDLARVFANGDRAIAVLFGLGSEQKSVLPAGLPVKAAEGLDGRTIAIADGTVSTPDDLVYLHLDRAEVEPFLKTDTEAMRLWRYAHDFKDRGRAAKPVVLQSDLEVENLTFDALGYYIEDYGRIRMKAKFNNLSDREVKIAPALKLPYQARLYAFDAAEVTVPPKTALPFAFEIGFEPGRAGRNFLRVELFDRNGNATPLVWSIQPTAIPEAEARPLTAAAEKFDWASLRDSGNWTDISAPENWQAWEGDFKQTIQAKFRAFWTPETVQLQILVHDPVFAQPFQAAGSWQGDSVQISLRQDDPDTAYGDSVNWHEFTAAEVNGQPTLFRHIGPGTQLPNSSLEFIRLPEDHYLYVLNLDKADFGLNPVPGATIGLSFLVNNCTTDRREGFLKWGEGIIMRKDHNRLNSLKLVQ